MYADRHYIVFASAATAVITAVVTSLFTLSLASRSNSLFPSGPQSSVPTAIKTTNLPIYAPTEALVVEAVKKTSPAVVSIVISAEVSRSRQSQESPAAFDSPQDSRLEKKDDTQSFAVGGGSGFLATSDGYIITNRHVINQKNVHYTVFTNDGKEHKAQVAALDPILDIGVLKIEGSNFPHLTFGDSSTLEVGQTVIAIGNALAQFQNTVSVGVISGLSRSIIASDELGGTEML